MLKKNSPKKKREKNAKMVKAKNGRIALSSKCAVCGAVKLTKNAGFDKYKYSGYGFRFYSGEGFTHPSGRYGENFIIFRADLSSSKHANNKARTILVLGRDFIQGIDGTAIYAEKMYSTNFTVDNKTFWLSLHYNGDSSYLFFNGKEIIKFQAKDSETVPYPLSIMNGRIYL